MENDLFTYSSIMQYLMNSHRAVRAMNETLKQNRLLREQGEDGSLDDRNRSSDIQNNVNFLLS